MQDHIAVGNMDGFYKGVLSSASFRRTSASGQKCFFTVLSLHISNIYVKKNGTCKNLILTLRAIMISQEVDLVAGDFNGTAWRCRSRDNITVLLMKNFVLCQSEQSDTQLTLLTLVLLYSRLSILPAVICLSHQHAQHQHAQH